MGVAMSFNSAQYQPNFGGGASLPAGKYKVVLSNTEAMPTKDNTGGFLAMTLKVIEGPLAGAEHIDRLNLHNTSAEAVKIANERLSGYCYVIGVQGFNNTSDLENKPFGVEIGPQKDNPQYTEVKKLFDANGNVPARGAAPAAAAPAAPAGFGQQQPPAPAAAPAAPGWGGGAPAPAAAPAGFAAPAPAPAAAWGQPAAAAAPAAAPWGPR